MLFFVLGYVYLCIMSARQVVSLAVLGIVCLIGFILLKKLVKLVFLAVVVAVVMGLGYAAVRRL